MNITQRLFSFTTLYKFSNATTSIKEKSHPCIFPKSDRGKPDMQLSCSVSWWSRALTGSGGSIHSPHIDHSVPTPSSNKYPIITEGTWGDISLVTLQHTQRDLFYLKIKKCCVKLIDEEIEIWRHWTLISFRNLREIRSQAFCGIPAWIVNFLKIWASLERRGKV